MNKDTEVNISKCGNCNKYWIGSELFLNMFCPFCKSGDIHHLFESDLLNELRGLELRTEYAESELLKISEMMKGRGLRS